jgi:hypothetical protein
MRICLVRMKTAELNIKFEPRKTPESSVPEQSRQTVIGGSTAMRGRCLRWVKLRRTQCEHMFSALTLRAPFRANNRRPIAERGAIGSLCEGRMRGSRRSPLFHVCDSRLQIKIGKADTEILCQHIVKRLTAANCATIHFARWISNIKS